MKPDSVDLSVFEGHTPGPWRWCGCYLMQDCPARDGSDGKETNPFSTPSGQPIADDGSAGGEYSGYDMDSPDGLLLAAAPDLLAEVRRLRAHHETQRQAIEAFLKQWEVVQPHIDGQFALTFVRSGRQYTGPNLVNELAGLRAALSAGSPEPERT